ncbi:UNVERIFIED_CONTAM: hypothetical protein PYX00_004649 [Menopon gallinae]|uniref:Uncharacterized protein n=1 Tax=Menopon gallinae TaxID=328185 RepID=A0AAW2I694_9NEOP
MFGNCINGIYDIKTCPWISGEKVTKREGIGLSEKSEISKIPGSTELSSSGTGLIPSIQSPTNGPREPVPESDLDQFGPEVSEVMGRFLRSDPQHLAVDQFLRRDPVPFGVIGSSGVRRGTPCRR